MSVAVARKQEAGAWPPAARQRPLRLRASRDGAAAAGLRGGARRQWGFAARRV